MTQQKKLHKSPKMFLPDIDLRFKQNGDAMVNGNLFVAAFLERCILRTLGGCRYYRYSKKKHFWEEISLTDVKRLMRKFLHQYEPDIWNSAIEQRCLTILPLECGKAEDLKNADSYINTLNGLVNLNTFELEPHNSDVFTTVQLSVMFDPSADCPNFKDFLDVIFKGDKELKRLAGEMFGYVLSSKQDAQVFFILASEGSSGKSTLCDLLYNLAGRDKNVSAVAMGDFNKKFARSQLVDKVLNLSTESDVSGSLDTQAIKAITSGDPLQLEAKGKPPITYRVKAKLVFAVNSLPFPKDKSYAFIRRMIIIPFPMRFVDNPSGENEAKIDRDIKAKLMPELAGVLNFALRGLKRLQNNEFKFTEPECVRKLLLEYRRDINPVYDYTKLCIRRADGLELDTKIIDKSFRSWCTENGHSRSAAYTTRRFLREFRNILVTEGIPFNKRKSNGRCFISGISFSKAGKTFAPIGWYEGSGVKESSIDELGC
jgi:putative DNA primase/helicase